MNPLKIFRNKRALMTMASYVSIGFGFFHIWRKRKEIDAILDTSYDARHSSDPNIRKEANWDTTKKLVPVVAPAAVAMVLGSAGVGYTAVETQKELNHVKTTTEQLSAALASGSLANGQSEQNIINEERMLAAQIIPPNTRPYQLVMTGEILYFPKDWHSHEMPYINKVLLQQWENSDEGLTLGDIRWELGLHDNIIVDNLIKFPLQTEYRKDPPQLRIEFPQEFHGRGVQQDIMLEIHIDGFMTVDKDY